MLWHPCLTFLLSACLPFPVQLTCGRCNRLVKPQREAVQLAAQAEADSGVWKLPGRALTVVKKKIHEVFLKTDGKAEICVIMFRPDAQRNRLSIFGEQLV